MSGRHSIESSKGTRLSIAKVKGTGGGVSRVEKGDEAGGVNNSGNARGVTPAIESTKGRVGEAGMEGA